jgi:hypothetical protein
MMNPIFPEAQPWANYVMALTAVAIVLRDPQRMLRRDGAVTDVLWREDRRASVAAEVAGPAALEGAADRR